MPIYEYRCKKCGGIFEAMQRFGASPPVKCELCGASGKNLVKLISPAQVIFKGSGFYLTDHRNAINSNIDTPTDHDKDTSSESGNTESKPKAGAGKTDN